MRTGCGFNVTLDLKDKEDGDAGKVLECKLFELNTKLFLHIFSRVPWKGFLEEPGFHIVGKPKEKKSDEERERYDIYLSKERWISLTNPTEDPIVDGGYCASRSRYDRVDIKYFAIGPKFKPQ